MGHMSHSLSLFYVSNFNYKSPIFNRFHINYNNNEIKIRKNYRLTWVCIANLVFHTEYMFNQVSILRIFFFYIGSYVKL